MDLHTSLRLLLCCSLLACSTQQPLPTPPPISHQVYSTVYIDDKSPESDQAELGEAVVEWNYAFQNHVVLHPVVSNMNVSAMSDPYGILLMEVDSTCTFIPVRESTVLAFTEYLNGRKIWFVRDAIALHSATLHQIALHELGHVFGAPDRETPGLMYKHIGPNQPNCIDEDTARIVQEALGIPTRKSCK